MSFVIILIYVSIYLGLIATTFYIIGYNVDRHRKKPLYSDSELPKVSIIIPAYNEEKSIGRTIESILASDYPKNKFEVIVVDDGSKDNTLKIAKKYQSNLVKVYTKTNGGLRTLLLDF